MSNYSPQNIMFNKTSTYQFLFNVFYNSFKVLLLSRLPSIYEEFYHTVNNADHEKDLRWWSNTHGVNMAMAWPQFEVRITKYSVFTVHVLYRNQVNTVYIEILKIGQKLSLISFTKLFLMRNINKNINNCYMKVIPKIQNLKISLKVKFFKRLPF